MMNKVDIFFTTLPPNFCAEWHLSTLPLFLQTKIKKIRHSQTQKLAILSKVLLQTVLHDTLQALQYSALGRPYLKNQPNFNLSHTDHWVVCALTEKGKIGIDLEKIKMLNYQGLLKRFFNAQEQALFQTEKGFFEGWTRKEAILKAQGCGLRVELKQIDVSKNPVLLEQPYWFSPVYLPFENSVCHLATNFPDPIFSLQAIEIPCGY
ncbi:MAG: hypothetical protein RIT27_1883 [Pseudomonadota bacterium]